MIRTILTAVAALTLLAGCLGATTLPVGRTPTPPSSTQQNRLTQLSLPAQAGDPEGNIVIAVAVVTTLRERDGTIAAFYPERLAGIPIALNDAASRIDEYSGGRYRLRFEIRVIDEMIEAESTTETHRWPSPVGLRDPIERAFPGGADAAIAFMAPPLVDGRPVELGLTGRRHVFGATRPLTALTSPYVYLHLGKPIPIAMPVRSGDLLIHEFGHVVEIWSQAQGHTPLRIHDAVEAGYPPAFRNNYDAWYRFFFSHPDLFHG